MTAEQQAELLKKATVARCCEYKHDDSNQCEKQCENDARFLVLSAAWLTAGDDPVFVCGRCVTLEDIYDLRGPNDCIIVPINNLSRRVRLLSAEA
jgi:hypothetical protein